MFSCSAPIYFLFLNNLGPMVVSAGSLTHRATVSLRLLQMSAPSFSIMNKQRHSRFTDIMNISVSYTQILLVALSR